MALTKDLRRGGTLNCPNGTVRHIRKMSLRLAILSLTEHACSHDRLSREVRTVNKSGRSLNPRMDMCGGGKRGV